jgi:hypothetical protein
MERKPDQPQSDEPQPDELMSGAAEPDDRAPPFSGHALHLCGLLVRHGGLVRIGPLLQRSRLRQDDLCAALDELSARCWIEIVWRPRRAHRHDDATRPLRDIRYVRPTRFGRQRYPVTWPA